MWKLAPPHPGDVFRDMNCALTHVDGTKTHRITRSQREGLLRLYQKYDSLGGQPSKCLLGTRFAEIFRFAVRDAYSQVQETGRLAALRSRLKLSAEKCPYCGFGEISELDHHLPRSKYNLFAIYARNLIPCCHVCNSKKSALAKHQPDAQIAHVYFQEFPQARFMFAHAEVSENSLYITFSIAQCSGMENSLFQRLKFQFERFELNERYQREVNDFLSSHGPSIEDAARGGPASLRSWLERSRNDLQKKFGLNDWRPVVLDALLQSNDFWALSSFEWVMRPEAARFSR